MQHILNSVIAARTEEGYITVSRGMTEEVAFDLSLNGGIGACLKEMFGWLLWTGNCKCQEMGRPGRGKSRQEVSGHGHREWRVYCGECGGWWW